MAEEYPQFLNGYLNIVYNISQSNIIRQEANVTLDENCSRPVESSVRSTGLNGNSSNFENTTNNNALLVGGVELQQQDEIRCRKDGDVDEHNSIANETSKSRKNTEEILQKVLRNQHLSKKLNDLLSDIPNYQECFTVDNGTSLTIHTHCENGSRCSTSFNQPLAYGHGTHRLFVNKLCALCNGDSDISDAQITVEFRMERNWSLHYHMNNLSLHQFFMELRNYNCAVYLTVTKRQDTHYCTHNKFRSHVCIPHENDCWKSDILYNLCRMFQAPVILGDKIIKNVFCSKCTNIAQNQISDTTCISNTHQILKPIEDLCSYKRDPLKGIYKVLFARESSTTVGSASSRSAEYNTSCDWNEVFYKGLCQPLSTLPDLTFHSSLIKVKTTIVCSVTICIGAMKVFLRYNATVVPVRCDTSRQGPFLLGTDISLLKDRKLGCLILTVYKSGWPELYLNVLRYLSKFSHNGLLYFYFDNTLSPYSCSNGKMYTFRDTANVHLESEMVQSDIGYNSTISNILIAAIYRNNESHYKLERIQMEVSACMSILQLCEKAVLDVKDISIDHGAVVSRFLKRKLQPSEYLIVSKDVLFCADMILKQNTLKFISVIGNSLSITCLVISLVIYAAIAELQTVPGKMLINYMTSLLMAQLTLQFSGYFVNYKYVCKGVGALQHYCWLTSFTASNALAIKLDKTISQGLIQTQNTTRSYVRYTLITLVLPLLVIVPGVTLDVLDNGLFYYGGVEICWISDDGRLGKYEMFAYPVLTAVSANMILFVRIFLNLQKNFQASSEVNAYFEHKQVALVYLKLFSLSGMTWLLGFLPKISGVTEFWYAFEVINSLQGVYVFSAFGLSTRARRLMFEKLRNFLQKRQDDHQIEAKCSREKQTSTTPGPSIDTEL